MGIGVLGYWGIKVLGYQGSRVLGARFVPAAAAATGYNPCPGSNPLFSHVPRGCTNLFQNLTLAIKAPFGDKSEGVLYKNYINI